MTIGEFFTSFFSLIWQLFSLESPFFGLKFYEILIGAFVIELAIHIFVTIFNNSEPLEKEKTRRR